MSLGKTELLTNINFPAYSIIMASDRHFIVSGGGGASSTGVKNGFQVFEIYYDDDKCHAEQVLKYDTGDYSIMNSDCISTGNKILLAIGQDASSFIFELKPALDTITFMEKRTSKGEIEVRRRRLSSRSSNNLDDNEDATSIKKRKSRIVYEATPISSFQTDFCKKEEPLQKVVKIASNNKFLSTGGVDGIIRIWKIPTWKKFKEIKAHSKEIDDIAFDKHGKLLVSVSKDKRCCLWLVETGKLFKEIIWKTNSNTKYVYKRCRIVGSKEEEFNIYTILNPLGTKENSCLLKWNSSNLDSPLNKYIFNESLSALAVSSDGEQVAVGTMFSGTVHIFLTRNFKKLYTAVKTHNTFVTGLDFLPSTLESKRARGVTEISLLSVSVDNQVKLHQIDYKTTLPISLAVFGMVMLLLLSFLICKMSGL